jgi:DNA-binding transcriptional MerR regulator
MTSADDNVIHAFTADHVVRITGLSHRQLSYWDSTGFFAPWSATEDRRGPYARIYSFKDVRVLRTLSILRKDYEIPLQHLRKVAEALSQLDESPWSSQTLYVLGKRVQFREPNTGLIRDVLDKQYVNLPLRSIVEDVELRAAQLKERSAKQVGRIVRHRYIAHNNWVVAGTRIPIGAIRRFRDAGYSTEQIVEEYPMLKPQDIAAALRHRQKRSKAA